MGHGTDWALGRLAIGKVDGNQTSPKSSEVEIILTTNAMIMIQKIFVSSIARASRDSDAGLEVRAGKKFVMNGAFCRKRITEPLMSAAKLLDESVTTCKERSADNRFVLFGVND